ncbi:MAG: isoprenylcysteine carboxylmethyltransferase family protein [Pyrinomonadaceae bacterium]
MNKEEIPDNAGVIAFPPALYVGTLLLGLIFSFIFPTAFLPRVAALIFGIITAICAALLAISAFRTMNRAQTGINPSLPTTTIVSDGVFGFSRNPIYLSLTLLYVGIALIFNAFWALLLLLPLLAVVQNGIIKREENYLERKFGAEYSGYKTRVRRWI